MLQFKNFLRNVFFVSPTSICFDILMVITDDPYLCFAIIYSSQFGDNISFALPPLS